MPVTMEWLLQDGTITTTLTPDQRQRFTETLSKLLTPLAYQACLSDSQPQSSPERMGVPA